MHRQTPLTSGFIGYTSGGARALVDTIMDNPLMQEMKGTFMFGEARDKIESPQNYGFTSVVKEATKGKDGMIEECAEAFISFLGGNRTFPIATVMDDRRFRLKELKPGDVAIFDHLKQQFHFNKDGAFLTGLLDKKIRFALHKVEEEQQGGGGGAGAATLAESGGSSGGESGSQKKKQGQKQRYEKAEQESKRFVDLNAKNIGLKHDEDIGVNADKNVGVKAGQTLGLEGTAIKRKAGAHYFDGDVHVMGNLYISQQGFKPTGPEWAPGSATPGPTDADDVFEYVKRPPLRLNAEQLADFERRRTTSGRIKVQSNGDVVIEGDFTVTGNLIVNGVVRAKGFETI